MVSVRGTFDNQNCQKCRQGQQSLAATREFTSPLESNSNTKSPRTKLPCCSAGRGDEVFARGAH